MVACFSYATWGMSIPISRQFPTSVDEARNPGSREATLDDTIESSFPASDPPSSIPDPEPDLPAAVAAIEHSLVESRMFWVALGAVAISAVWLGLTWQRGRLG